MGGIICVLAIIVIVCFIYWKKSQNKRIPEAKKSIEKVNKDDSSKKENLHKTSDNSNEVSNIEDLERKNKKEVYDASRKKDRGKKRREKKKSNEIKSEATNEEVKVEKIKSNESKKETRLYNQDIDVKVSKDAEKVKEDAKASKENSETLEKEVKKENQVKPKEVKEEKKVKAEEIKVEKENLKITNEKYSDLISSLKDNPWQKEDLNTKVKLENTRTKKTISEEEIVDLPLEKIKSSLSPESISDFLNVVKTNPTILKRKDDTAYEFTSKDKDEIDLIKKRYNLLDRDIEKITSVLIFDKDNLKLKEVKDILAEGKNRIYMETKF